MYGTRSTELLSYPKECKITVKWAIGYLVHVVREAREEGVQVGV